MKRWRIPDAMLPWTGLITGVTGLAIAHQVGSDTVFDHCLVGSPWVVIIVVLAGLALSAYGGLTSWRTYDVESEGPARKLIAIISVGAAVLFSLVMILSLISALAIPPCFA
jgi:hypothetical protein